MTIGRCERGHFYDEDEYDKCPYCGGPPVQDGGKSPPIRRISYPHNVFSRRPAAVYAGPPLQDPAPKPDPGSKPAPEPAGDRFPTAAIVTIAVAGTVLLAALLYLVFF